MIAIGPDGFHELLDGFHAMDEHFGRPAGVQPSCPHGTYRRVEQEFPGCATVAVLPYYEQYLKRFPAYLQQLTMESNGKHVTLEGTHVTYDTGPYWGEPGTNGQHSFYQLIHQGTSIIPSDFLFFAKPLNKVPAVDAPDHHDLLIANVLAQAGGSLHLARRRKKWQQKVYLPRLFRTR